MGAEVIGWWDVCGTTGFEGTGFWICGCDGLVSETGGRWLMLCGVCDLGVEPLT